MAEMKYNPHSDCYEAVLNGRSYAVSREVYETFLLGYPGNREDVQWWIDNMPGWETEEAKPKRTKTLIQQLTEELTAQTARAQQFEATLKEQQERERVLRQIVDALFQIAEPGAVKNALWARYQGLSGASSIESEM